jgi:hypothetical protein
MHSADLSSSKFEHILTMMKDGGAQVSLKIPILDLMNDTEILEPPEEFKI